MISLMAILDGHTHLCKPMIGDKSTGIINIKSEKIIACTQPLEST